MKTKSFFLLTMLVLNLLPLGQIALAESPVPGVPRGQSLAPGLAVRDAASATGDWKQFITPSGVLVTLGVIALAFVLAYCVVIFLRKQRVSMAKTTTTPWSNSGLNTESNHGRIFSPINIILGLISFASSIILSFLFTWLNDLGLADHIQDNFGYLGTDLFLASSIIILYAFAFLGPALARAVSQGIRGFVGVVFSELACFIIINTLYIVIFGLFLGQFDQNYYNY